MTNAYKPPLDCVAMGFIEEFREIIITEAVGAVVFVGLIVMMAAIGSKLPNVSGLIPYVAILWGLYGIGTPLVLISSIRR